MILKRGEIVITLFCLYILDNKDVIPTSILLILTSILMDIILIPLELLFLIAILIYSSFKPKK